MAESKYKDYKNPSVLGISLKYKDYKNPSVLGISLKYKDYKNSTSGFEKEIISREPVSIKDFVVLGDFDEAKSLDRAISMMEMTMPIILENSRSLSEELEAKRRGLLEKALLHIRVAERSYMGRLKDARKAGIIDDFVFTCAQASAAERFRRAAEDARRRYS